MKKIAAPGPDQLVLAAPMEIATPEIATPIESVCHDLITRSGLVLEVKREDLLHPSVSGNKWHKLKYNLEKARELGYSRIVSFGGAYSNHLHALAYAGNRLGFETIGVIRGELVYPLNPTLQDAVNWGMQLIPVSRGDYRRQADADYVQTLLARFDPCWVIPEGGANTEGVRGCMEWVEAILSSHAYDYICVPCGSGATLAGVIAGARDRAQVLGFSVLKGQSDLEMRVQEMLARVSCSEYSRWRIVHGYDCGGFARINQTLADFIAQWQSWSSIPIEPVYSAKLFYGVFDCIQASNVFTEGCRILVLHTGGLQGLRGSEQRLKQFWRNAG